MSATMSAVASIAISATTSAAAKVLIFVCSEEVGFKVYQAEPV